MRFALLGSSMVIFLCLGACAGQSLDPKSVGQPKFLELPWRLHCETNRSFIPDMRTISGLYQGNWIWGEDRSREQVTLLGELEDGFFTLEGVVTASGEALPAKRQSLRKLCLETIMRDEPRDLARVADLARELLHRHVSRQLQRQRNL